MLMEETWRPGNFIISQMVKGTIAVKEWEKESSWTEHMLLVGDNSDFFFLLLAVFISSLAFMEPIGRGEKKMANGPRGSIWNPRAEPLKW